MRGKDTWIQIIACLTQEQKWQEWETEKRITCLNQNARCILKINPKIEKRRSKMSSSYWFRMIEKQKETNFSIDWVLTRNDRKKKHKTKLANDSMSTTILPPDVRLKLMTFPCRPQWRIKNRITDDKMRVFLNARDSSLLFSSSIKSLGKELSYTETIELLLFFFPFLDNFIFQTLTAFIESWVRWEKKNHDNALSDILVICGLN